MLLVLLAWLSGSVQAGAAPGGAPNEVSYRISAELAPEDRRIDGEERVRVVNRTGAALERLYFHVYPNAFRRERDGTYMREMRAIQNPDSVLLASGEGESLEVSKVVSAGHALAFGIERELMTVELGRALASGESIELEIGFVTRLGGVSERSGTWDGNFAVGQWFPKLVVHDSGGWALEHNAGYHFTGEFYGDFGDYEVTIGVPDGMKVGATGKLTSDILSDATPGSSVREGRRRLTFRAEHVHDFAWVADAAFKEDTLVIPAAELGPGARDVKIHVLFRNEDVRVIGAHAAAAVRYYSKRVGPYPYDDFTVAETYYEGPEQYPQVVFIESWPAWLSRWVERDATRLLELAVVHETAHQWFYGAVGNNEVTDAWLDEGFATYLEIAFMRDTYGANENILKLTDLFRFNDRQLGWAAWRSVWYDVKAPIRTPSYLFNDPGYFYTSVYYRAAQFFQHFEALVGTEKLDGILQEFFRENLFRNARPDDWYRVVRERAGAEAERWWRDWIEKPVRCDYAVSGLSSRPSGDGRYMTSLDVAQLGSFFAPVDVELETASGERLRVRANPTAEKPVDRIEKVTDARVTGARADPDEVTGDSDRFNDSGGFFPKLAWYPVTTRTLEQDAITIAPIPLLNKRPGLGIETGILIPVAHALDWQGTAAFAWDWLHQSPTVQLSFDTLAPDAPWGWTVAYESDSIVDHGGVYVKKYLGPNLAHDPSQTLLFGPELFGELGDGARGIGGGVDYLYSDLAQGHDLGWSFELHDSVLAPLGTASGVVDRAQATLTARARLGFKSTLTARGTVGESWGAPALSELFDLLGEGGMRFEWGDDGTFKLRRLEAASLEASFPVPYSPWVDRLAVIHGPAWEWHIFSDVSNSPAGDRAFADAGIGTTLAFAMGGFGGLSARLDFVPYQNAIAPTGWGAPVFLFNLLTRTSY
jgi:hypothetical protein